MPQKEEMLKNFNKFYDVSIQYLLIGVALHLKAPKIPCCLNMARLIIYIHTHTHTYLQWSMDVFRTTGF
jgi:hypothetical protein